MFGCVGRLLAVAVVLASVVPVLGQAQCPDGSPAPCRSAAVAAPAPTSVAVLYFDNASPDSTDDYLAEGLTEAIIAQLGQVGRISVKSRSAVRRFRGANVPDPPVIGRTLGVAYLVTGSVQRADRALRITIELAHTATGTRVWGDQFVGADDSLFALEDNIARRVAEGVAGRLLPTERRAVAAVGVTRNPQAYQHFLRGHYGLDQRTAATDMGDDSTAITAWRRALAIDPGRPITLRAYAQMVVPAEARSLLDSALAVDPGFQVARLSRADTRLAQGDTSGARHDLQASRCEVCAADMWPSWTAWHGLPLGSHGGTAAD